jgi:hypothetical protein
MFEGDREPLRDDLGAASDTRQSRLRRLLDERPEARTRIGRAVAVLLGTGLFAFAAFGALLIWHIVRRGRLIRERLSAPRVVRLPELPNHEIEQPPEE